MRFSTLATAAAATLVAAEDMSLCGKYTTALFKEDTAANEAKLLTALVNTVVIGNCMLNWSPLFSTSVC